MKLLLTYHCWGDFISFLRTTLNIKLHVKRDTEGEKRDEWRVSLHLTLRFVHKIRFDLSLHQFMVSRCVCSVTMCEWLAKSLEWQNRPIHSYLSATELWLTSPVSFANLCHFIAENQAYKIITELQDRGKEKLIHWPPLACLFSFPKGRCLVIIYRNDYCCLARIPKIVITFISDKQDGATFAPELLAESKLKLALIWLEMDV